MSRRTHLTIVAIDDNPADLELLRCYLEEIPDLCVDLTAFTDADTGLTGVTRCSPDIILVDYYLGHTSGLDLCERFHEQGIDAPVILLTGRGDENVAMEAIRAGVVDYLPKDTATPESLARSLAHATEKFDLQREVETHRRRLECTVEDLQRSNDEIRSFYHTLSHEMNTPLASAREFVSIVLDGLAGGLTPDQSRYLGIARESCDRISLYLRDLLDASRLETGKLVVDRSPRPIAATVDHVVATLTAKAEKEGLKLTGRVAPDLPDVLIDEHRIIQVLTNLVNNAIKFTPEGGEIRLTAEPVANGSAIEVAVADTGTGIPPDCVDRIFDRLYQVQQVEHGSGGGLGIGLFLAQQLIRLHDGEIRVNSRLGDGTTFTCALPTVARDGDPAGPAPSVETTHEQDSCN